MTDITKLKTILKNVNKSSLLEFAEKRGMDTEELKKLTNKQIQQKIIEHVENSNLKDDTIQQDLFQENLKEEVEMEKEVSILGKNYVRKDDTSEKPKVFQCTKVDEEGITFTYKTETIKIHKDEIDEYFVEAESQVSKTNEVSVEEEIEEAVEELIPVLENIVVEEPTIEQNLIEVPTDEEKEDIEEAQEAYVGPGRGRLTAIIRCYDNPERKNPIQEFTTFADVRNWLTIQLGKKVQSLGNSLENASESGKPSRGYWWTVEEAFIEPPKTKKKETEKEKKVKKLKEQVSTEEIVIEGPSGAIFIDDDKIIEDAIVQPVIKKEEPPKKEESQEFDIFNGL